MIECATKMLNVVVDKLGSKKTAGSSSGYGSKNAVKRGKRKVTVFIDGEQKEVCDYVKKISLLIKKMNWTIFGLFMIIIILFFTVIVLLWQLVTSRCSIGQYLLANHFYKYLKDDRAVLFSTILNNLMIIVYDLEKYFVYPFMKTTLDHNMKLVIDGVDVNFLKETIQKIRLCSQKFVDPTKYKDYDSYELFLERKRIEYMQCLDGFSNEDFIYKLYKAIKKMFDNVKENKNNFKFATYNSLPNYIQANITKEQYNKQILLYKDYIRSIGSVELPPYESLKDTLRLT
jgi:hypothetical protein